MSAELIFYVPIAFAVIAYVMYKQIAWRRINTRKMLLMPAVLAALGLFDLKNVVAAKPAVGPVDLAFVAAQIVVAVGIGLAMGKITVFAADGGGEYFRSGKFGAVLWTVYIAARLGLDVAAGAVGSEFATSMAMILLTVAVNRFTQSALVLARRSRGAAPSLAPASASLPASATSQTAHSYANRGENPAAECGK